MSELYKVDDEKGEAKGEEAKSAQTLPALFFSLWYMLGPRPRVHIVQTFFFIICLAAILPWVSE